MAQHVSHAVAAQALLSVAPADGADATDGAHGADGAAARALAAACNYGVLHAAQWQRLRGADAPCAETSPSALCAAAAKHVSTAVLTIADPSRAWAAARHAAPACTSFELCKCVTIQRSCDVPFNKWDITSYPGSAH